MNSLDIIVPAVIIVGTLIGWKKGFIETICSFAGFFLGLVIAYMLYGVVGQWLAPSLGGNVSIACLIAFLIIWVAVPVALDMVGNTFTHILKALPIFGKVNSLAGALIGFVKWFLLACCVVNALIFAGVIGPEVVEQSWWAAFMKAFFESFVDAYRESSAA